jgi:hypothetical protein
MTAVRRGVQAAMTAAMMIRLMTDVCSMTEFV